MFKAEARVARCVAKLSSVIIQSRRRVFIFWHRENAARMDRTLSFAFKFQSLTIIAPTATNSQLRLHPLRSFHLHFASLPSPPPSCYFYQLRCFVSHAPVHFLSFRKVKRRAARDHDPFPLTLDWPTDTQIQTSSLSFNSFVRLTAHRSFHEGWIL